MIQRSSERGQALILIAFAAVALFAFAALAIDGSRVFSDRRHAQNAADTAALAAALAKVRGNDYVNAAVLRAQSNGFDTANSTVEVHQCDEAGLNPPCEGLPSSADASQYIQIVIRMSTPTTFARILGWQQVPTVVSAVARAVTGESPVGSNTPAVSAMSPTDPSAIHGNGNFNLEINNSGIFDNSNAAGGCPNGSALLFNGNGTYDVDTGYEVVGQSCDVGSNTIIGDFKTVTQQPYPPQIDIDAPSITCSGDTTPAWSGTGWLIPPGNHAYMDIPGGSVTFAPGNHCFPAGFRLSGNTPTITANDANFLISGGVFDITSNGSFNCSNLLVHVNGGTGMRLNGNGTSNCTGVTFYLSTGNVTWNGNSTNIFSAPTSGTYKGLLVYLPYGNSNPLTISGNASSEFTGSIIAVSSPIQLQGNNATLALSTKIIGYTVGFSGNGKFQINYDPSQQYAQGEPTMIQLTK
jgi:Flp pilus assembly protein TadG